MADTSEAELPPQTNGISEDVDEEERGKMRPADIDADVKEMERRKRVELIMNSKLFREELERIIELQLRDGSGTSGLMQQISDMMGVSKTAGNVFKNSNCVVPINDIRGIEAMGYAKGEKILRCKLAAVYRLIDLYGWTQGTGSMITARLNQDEEHFLANPYGMLYHEITASSLVKADMQGNIVEQGTTNFGINLSAYSLHAAIHAARPDIKCIIHVHTPSVVAISALKCGLLPISQESVVIGDVSTHAYIGGAYDPEEKDKIARNLGPNNKVLLLNNQGAVCCGETIEEAFFNARNTVLASESQLKLLPVGLDNLVLLDDETRKRMYDAAHKAPESSPRPDQPSILETKIERKWRVGGVEFEALMRMLDNAGFRTGYIYRHPLVKGDVPKPRNDVEVPPAVSSLGYLLEEEELYKQGLWKKLEGGRKGHDRTRWLNSPNVYQKVEILETGTPDPKKITKWVADGSPTHSNSTPVKIDSALQFVPKNTNPKEFKKLQQQIKDYRRADKISAGPQSHILEGVTWEEARKMQDAGVTQTGDQVVLMGAASKGIIQRGYQHNATMYKSPYAKNPFDSITDEEIDEYKKVVEKKTKGEYDTDFSESEGLSSAQINKRISDIRSPTSAASETEEESRDEPQVLRIETKHAPKPSQPEVVLSDGRRAVKLTVHPSTVPLVYRTNNYAGFPKGSYAVPNPKHFHIVRTTRVSQHSRPNLVRIGRSDSSASSQISVTVKGAPPLTVNISMDTLKNFIIPFANALSLSNMSTQSSQTSYVAENQQNMNFRKSCSYTPLIESYRSSFEQEIMESLRRKLVADVTLSDDDYFTSTSSFSFVDPNDNMCVTQSIPAEERMECCSFGIPAPSEMPAELELSFEASETSDDCNTQNCCNTSSLYVEFNDELDSLKDYSFFESPESKSVLLNSTVEDDDKFVSDGFGSDIEKLYCDSDTLSSTATYIIDREVEDDEGAKIDVIAEENESFGSENISNDISENIKDQMANLIANYLAKSCLELNELVVFPEIMHDDNLKSLLLKLNTLYGEYFQQSYSETDKSELRISLGVRVMNKLQLDSSEVSDKMFTVTEFLSEMLDHIFTSLDLSEVDFEKNLIDHHSTPEKRRSQVVEEVSCFQTKRLNSGNEFYWVAICKSPAPKQTEVEHRPRQIFNVDDIPLRPPEDLNLRASTVETDLSARTVLFNEVQFYRTGSANTSPYVQSNNVAFSKTNSKTALHEDEVEDGDWMGFHEAKF